MIIKELLFFKAISEQCIIFFACAKWAHHLPLWFTVWTRCHPWKIDLLTDWFFSQNSLLCNRERINLSLTFVLSNKDLILWNLMRVEKSGKKLRSNCKYLKLQSRCSFPHCNLKALLIWSSLIVSTNFVIFIGLIVAYSGTTVG